MRGLPSHLKTAGGLRRNGGGALPLVCRTTASITVLTLAVDLWGEGEGKRRRAPSDLRAFEVVKCSGQVDARGGAVIEGGRDTTAD